VTSLDDPDDVEHHPFLLAARSHLRIVSPRQGN